MELKSSQLKANARGHLTGKYAFPMIAYMITDMVISTVTMIASLMGDTQSDTGKLINMGISIILSAIMTIFLVGQSKICLDMARNTQYPAISDIWYGFKGYADNIIILFFKFFIRLFIYAIPFGFASVLFNSSPGVYSAVALIITFLFTIIMYTKLALDYGLIFFLIIDHPTETPNRLFEHSKELMYGNRKKLLYLYLSFTGMIILVLLSFGFAIFWVFPYFLMTLTEFYIALTTEPVSPEINADATEYITN